MIDCTVYFKVVGDYNTLSEQITGVQISDNEIKRIIQRKLEVRYCKDIYVAEFRIKKHEYGVEVME